MIVVSLAAAGCTQTPLDYSHVDSFDACVAAGLPVMESYPEQCRTPDGRTFSRIVEEALIEVTDPQPGDDVGGTFLIEGRARGMWYFEASFPVDLLDGDGNVIASVPAQALSDWMTEEFVPFQATLTVPASAFAQDGELVLRKANASGLPEHDDEVRVPVRIVAE